MFNFSDFPLHNVLEIKFDKFELFAGETLIHEIEP